MEVTDAHAPSERQTHLATLANYGYQTCLDALLVESASVSITAPELLRRCGVDTGDFPRPVALNYLRLQLVEAGRWAIRSGHLVTEDRVHGCQVPAGHKVCPGLSVNA